jgi:hypothetical protein
MGGHADTSQALIFMVIDSVPQGGYDWEVNRCGLFRPGPTVLGKSANEGQEVRFMVFAIKSGLVPSLERSLHWQIQEVTARAFIGRSKRPLQGHIWRPMPPITFHLSALD